MNADPAADLRARVAQARERIDAAARRGGRGGDAVTLVGVTKTRAVDEIARLVAAGVSDLGENRAQELTAKAPALAGLTPRWHMIGQCQTNKVRALAPIVAVWQTVDRSALVDEIARRAPGATVLVQVDVSDLNGIGASGRGGVNPEGLSQLIDDAAARGLAVAGLMAVAPLGVDPRPAFEQVAALRDRNGLRELSIGMSDDFEIAVEVGATIVRLGRVLFCP